MSVAKIAISIDAELLKKLDSYVVNKKFKNRSQAIQLSVLSTIKRLEHARLHQECQKLNPAFEQQIANENLNKDMEEWPEF